MTSILAGAASIHATGLRASAATAANASASQGTTATPAPEFYLWRQYILRNGTAPRRLADYLQNAAIPALNRLGHAPIGVFEVVAGVPGPTAFVLTPLPTLDALGTLETRLEKDADYVKAAAAYLDVTAADPAYVRMETSLLSAFPKFPRLVLPAATATKGPRLFELRTYESPSEKTHGMKVKMFSEMGEIEIFKRVGLTPVFFSRTLTGPRMPSLVYMLVHDDMAGREKSWNAFEPMPNGRRCRRPPATRMRTSSRTSPRCTCVPPPTRRFDARRHRGGAAAGTSRSTNV